MLREEAPNLVGARAELGAELRVLLLGGEARLEEEHLDAALHVDLAVTRGLDRAEDALRVLARDEALHPVADAG